MQQPEPRTSIIEQTTAAHQELIALLQRQREALLQRDEQQMHDLTQQLYQQLLSIAHYQQQCEEMCAAGQLSPYLSGQLGHTLQRTVQRGQFEGQLNQEMISDLLAYTDYSLRLLLPEQYLSEGYDAQGRRERHTNQQPVARQIDKTV